eukprot:3538593-Pyramimonas_sp.AAC.1
MSLATGSLARNDVTMALQDPTGPPPEHNLDAKSSNTQCAVSTTRATIISETTPSLPLALPVLRRLRACRT